MPLPDAKPDPKKANIYEQFSHIQVKDFTRNNLDVVRDPLFLNSQSEDVLRRIGLIGAVSNQLSSSGVIPGSSNILVSVQSSGSSGDAILLQPPKGEVWQLMGISLTNSDTPTGSNRYYFFYSNTDPWSAASNASTVFLNSVDSSSTLVGFEFLEENVQRPMYVTNELYLAMYSNMSALPVGTTVQWKIAYHRVR